jgi:hypothetical protein
MSQMFGGTAATTAPMPAATDVGYTPQGPAGTPTAESSGGTPAGPGPAGGITPTFAKNLSLTQRFAEMLGKTPEERERNAKAFAALTKDISGITRTMSESSLMQRMMQEQMGGAGELIPGASPSGGIAAIPRTFDPGQASNIMSQLGFK